MSKIENLIVCGDSFNAISGNIKYKGTHWSEQLSRMLGVNLINLSSVGCSNRMIVMQVEEAMKYDKSLIIIAPAANSARIELLTQSSEFLNEDITLKNFVTNPSSEISPDAFIRSVNASMFKHDDSVPTRVKKILLENIPFGLFWHIDKWALYYMLDQLMKKQKNFLFIETVVHEPFQILSHQELVDLIGEKNIIAKEDFRFQFYIDRFVDKKFEDPGYHTTPSGQLVSAYLLQKIILTRSKINY